MGRVSVRRRVVSAGFLSVGLLVVIAGAVSLGAPAGSAWDEGEVPQPSWQPTTSEVPSWSGAPSSSRPSSSVAPSSSRPGSSMPPTTTPGATTTTPGATTTTPGATTTPEREIVPTVPSSVRVATTVREKAGPGGPTFMPVTGGNSLLAIGAGLALIVVGLVLLDSRIGRRRS